MWKVLMLLALFVTMIGCSLIQPVTGPFDGLNASVQDGVNNACSPMLGWLGGLCCLAGITLLVISRGTLGWRPLIGGVIFILINYALALYADWFFIPVAIATGAISLVWAGRIVWKIVTNDQIKEIKL